jgi:hypothetical protein
MSSGALKTSYTKEINGKNPTCFLFVIDQSGSMDETMSGGSIKSEFVADVLNRTIAETIVRCTKADGVRDCFEIGVIGYGSDDVGSAFGGALARRTLLPISEIERNPLRIEEREQDFVSGDDVLERQKVKFPVWIDHQHDGGGPHRAIDAHLALAQQYGAEMGQRREVTRRAHRALRRYAGINARVDQLDQRFDERETDAGIALAERRDLESHHQANHRIGQKRTGAGRV